MWKLKSPSDLGLEAPEHHFHCFLLDKSSHRTTPDSREGRQISFVDEMRGIHVHEQKELMAAFINTIYYPRVVIFVYFSDSKHLLSPGKQNGDGVHKLTWFLSL